MNGLVALLIVHGLAAIAFAQEVPQRPPNILILLADDLGYSDLGCYGSEIQTPNLDRLANGGLRFTHFYNTARCWPSRAALLTGYYPQQIRMDPPKGRLPGWTRTLPQYLKPAGYRCYHAGKWHLNGAPRVVADADFDRSYRVDDQDRHFSPAQLSVDDQRLPPVSRDAHYYDTTAIVDHAIGFLRDHHQQFSDRPFFQYVAFTVPHFPLMAPAEDIDRYRDAYREGWEKIRAQRYQRQQELGLSNGALSEPEAKIRAPSGGPNTLERLGPSETLFAVPWDSLTDEQVDFQSIKMAIHAAMIDRMDREIGRIIAQLESTGDLDNTLILFASDNGASAEILVRGDGHDPQAPAGSADSFLCLGPGWSTLCNTPFRRHKIWVHEGGISTPMIAHWPRGIETAGQWRHDVSHLIDVVPTLLEIAGVEPGATWNDQAAPPLPGRSLLARFAGDSGENRELYFSHQGNRALRTNAWKLVSAKVDDDRWELYDMTSDRSETHNVAAEHPDRVAEMAARWQELNDLFRRQAGLE